MQRRLLVRQLPVVPSWLHGRCATRRTLRKSAQFCAQFGALMLTRSRPSQGDGGGVQPLPRPAPPLGVDRRRRQAVARRIDLVGASGRVRARRRSGRRRRRRRRRPRQGVRIGTRLGLLGRLTRAQPAPQLSPRSSLPLLLSYPYRYDEHEQSVFGLVWSAADAWVFASLSLDGKCMISHVPPAEKYKILL